MLKVISGNFLRRGCYDELTEPSNYKWYFVDLKYSLLYM